MKRQKKTFTQEQVKEIFGADYGHKTNVMVKHEPIHGLVPLNDDKPIHGTLIGYLYADGVLSWWEFQPDDGSEPFDPADLVSEDIPFEEIERI